MPRADNAVPINGYVQKHPKPKKPIVVDKLPPTASNIAFVFSLILDLFLIS